MSSPDVPTNVTRIVVAGYFTDSNDVATAGKLVVTPDFTRGINDAWRRIVMAAPTSMEPSAATGLAYVSVVAGDDPDLNPSNFTHTVSEPGGRKYQIFVSQDTPVWTAGTPGHPLEGQRVLWLNSVAPSDAPSSGVVQVVAGPQGPPGEVSAAQMAAAVAAAKLADRPDLDTTGAAVGGVPAVSQVSPLLFGVRDLYDRDRRTASSLRAFREAVASVATAPVNIAVLGDSVTEGRDVGTDRWFDELRALLRARWQPVGVTGGEGYLPAFYAATGITDRWTVAGTVTLGTQYGPGMRAAHITSGAGNSITTTVTCSSFDILYTSNSATGDFTVSIDGGAGTTVDTTLGVTGTTRGGFRWPSGPLTPGSHTIAITNTSGATVLIEGVMVYNGDETKGVRFIEAGHSGWTADDYANDATALASTQSLVGCEPTLLIVPLGYNDLLAARSAAQFCTDLEKILSDVFSWARTPPSVLLLGYPPRLDRPVAAWPAYLDAMASVADVSDCAFLDLSLRLADINQPDSVHPDAAGHLAIATAVDAFLADTFTRGAAA